jgi:hypothetical protein
MFRSLPWLLGFAEHAHWPQPPQSMRSKWLRETDRRPQRCRHSLLTIIQHGRRGLLPEVVPHSKMRLEQEQRAFHLSHTYGRSKSDRLRLGREESTT